jgi:hypothetical protein
MSKRRHTFAVTVATCLALVWWVPVHGQTGSRSGPDRLSGTYELDRARSDDAGRIADQATRSLAPGQKDRAYQNLMARLDAPQSLAIDLQGRAVTIVSSAAPRMSFDADGRSHTETGPNGRPQTTRADVRGQELTVSTTGNRGSDYTVRFDPMPDGLRVMRELDSDALNATVTAQSYYRRVDAAPRWTVYDGGRHIVVRDGTQLTARLDRDLSSGNAREGDRFTMAVVAPGPYRGATLNGVVGRVDNGNGHAQMVFDFDRIRLADGTSAPFEGEIQSVRTPDGAEIRVNRSGGVRDRSGYDASNAQHAAIGAALGAIVGAIAGGGKGAAIGGVVGGAGTLLIDGRNNLSLPAGTEIVVTAVTPQAPSSHR